MCSFETTKKLDTIIKDLASILDFLKNTSLKKVDVDLFQLSADVSVLLSREIEESGVELKTNLKEDYCIQSVPAYINNIFTT